MTPLPLTRREAVRRILAATAVASTLQLHGFSAEASSPGLGFDPDLLTKEIPWPRMLTEAEKKIVTALADLILPADEFGPAASAVGVPDFIDEWVSAPYEQQVKDRGVIREGLAWLDAETKRRANKAFVEAGAEIQGAILKDITTDGTEARKKARAFFILFRDRAAGGYYSTREGWTAIGYTGNVPLVEYPGPPPEALKHVGLA
jgi:ribosomal protein S20